MLTFDLPVLLLVLGGVLGARIAPDADAAWPLFIAVLWGAAIYAATAVACRYRQVAEFVIGGAIVAAMVTAVAFALSGSHDSYPDKIAFVTRARLAMSAMSPARARWAPFPASVAMALEGAVVLALACATAARSQAARWSWAIATTVIGCGVLLTESRGAWVAVASALGVLACWRWRAVRVLALVAALGLALTLAPAARGPVHQWALALAADSPFAGTGLRGFEFSLSRYVLLIQVPFLAYAHSLYLDAWLQLGLPGLVAVVWILATTVASLLTSPTRHHRSAGWWRIGCNLGVLTVLLHGTTDARPFIDPWCGWLVFVLLGASRGLATMRGERQVAGDGPSASVRGADRTTMSVIVESWAGPVAALATVAGVAAWAGSPLAAARTGAGAARQASADYRAQRAPASDRGDTSESGRGALESAVQAAPSHASAHYRLGLLLMNEEHFAEARTHLDTAFRAWPSRPGAKKALGLAAVWTGDAAYAAALFRAQPEMVDELNTWGAYRASRGETALAASAYETSLLLDADQPSIRSAANALTGGETVRTPTP